MNGNRPPFVQSHEFVRPELPWASEERVQFLAFAPPPNYEDFRTECTRWDPEEPHLAVYAYNPLESKPIVKARRSGYVLPIPPYLMARVGMGVCYDADQGARKSLLERVRDRCCTKRRVAAPG